jgi:prepilin-type N-terminal cleavage/methylation domain-containing protein
MVSPLSDSRFAARGHVRARRGFTITELLVAMALITLIMSILSQAFVEGLESFRQLKGIGDLNERLRTAAIRLRTDAAAGHFGTNRFVQETLRTGAPDGEDAADLRSRYAAIAEDAAELDEGLREVGRQTTNPAARRLLARILDTLAAIRYGAMAMVDLIDLLDLINPPPPPPNDL